MQLLANLIKVEEEQQNQIEREKPHNSQFWIQKFMHQATKQLDPELGGVHQGMTPMAMLSSAKWRKTISDVQHEAAEKKRMEDEAEARRLQEVKERTEGVCFTSTRRKQVFFPHV